MDDSGLLRRRHVDGLVDDGRRLIEDLDDLCLGRWLLVEHLIEHQQNLQRLQQSHIDVYGQIDVLRAAACDVDSQRRRRASKNQNSRIGRDDNIR